ncbi:hypothetical protein OKA06_18080 [Novosphingobium sp. MW5]|nr:hypothetical protein [Novosphingobium sp. MW5]
MSRTIPALASLLLLAACSGGEDGETPEQAKRLVLPSQPAPLREAPKQPEGAVWSALPNGAAQFAAPGQPPLLVVSCEKRGTPEAVLRFTRTTRAEEGAKALFAIEGNSRVTRVKLDVVKPGEPGEWTGTVSAFDGRVEAIRGSYGVKATLPGGGTLSWSGSSVPGAVLTDCRAGLTLPKETPEADASEAPGEEN